MFSRIPFLLFLLLPATSVTLLPSRIAAESCRSCGHTLTDEQKHAAIGKLTEGLTWVWSDDRSTFIDLSSLRRVPQGIVDVDTLEFDNSDRSMTDEEVIGWRGWIRIDCRRRLYWPPDGDFEVTLGNSVVMVDGGPARPPPELIDESGWRALRRIAAKVCR